MALQILNAGPDPETIIQQIRDALAAALSADEGARIDVASGGPGHFEITVTSTAFEGLSRVKQQQLVYSAITPLMSGKNPPLQAVDKLTCRTP